MTARTIHYLLSVFILYILMIGAGIYIIRNEKISRKNSRLYKAIIVVDIIALIVFLVSCFAVSDKNIHSFASISLCFTIVVLWLETITIIVFDIKDAENRPKMLKRETFDLNEEFFTTEENIKVCYTKKKKSVESKGTIVFMHPNYYQTDLIIQHLIFKQKLQK